MQRLPFGISASSSPRRASAEEKRRRFLPGTPLRGRKYCGCVLDVGRQPGYNPWAVCNKSVGNWRGCKESYDYDGMSGADLNTVKRLYKRVPGPTRARSPRRSPACSRCPRRSPARARSPTRRSPTRARRIRRK